MAQRLCRGAFCLMTHFTFDSFGIKSKISKILNAELLLLIQYFYTVLLSPSLYFYLSKGSVYFELNVQVNLQK